MGDRWFEQGTLWSTLDAKMVPEVTVSKLAEGDDCWDACNGREGLCISCPFGYACCCKACANRLFDSNALECTELSFKDQAIGFHTCTKIPDYDQSASTGLSMDNRYDSTSSGRSKGANGSRLLSGAGPTRSIA